MIVLGFCNMQAFGPNVVTGHGPCKERVLLKKREGGREITWSVSAFRIGPLACKPYLQCSFYKPTADSRAPLPFTS